MQKKYNTSHRFVVFKACDFASLAIPKEDRGPIDNLRIAVKILKASHQNRYKVQSRYGIIKWLFCITLLNVVPEQHNAALAQQLRDVPVKEVILSAAATKAFNTNYVALACNCKMVCGKRCRCVKNSKFCSQYCHKSEKKLRGMNSS